jgi:hypothetical protein
MDELNEMGYFLLNIIMLVIFATHFWGIYALIVFGTVMATIGLTSLWLLFFEAATGYSPLQYFMKRKLDTNQ